MTGKFDREPPAGGLFNRAWDRFFDVLKASHRGTRKQAIRVGFIAGWRARSECPNTKPLDPNATPGECD